MATGVAKVESTANSAPASWAMAATALRSVSRMIGLAGVSAHTSAVGTSSAARSAARSEVSTSATSTPMRGRVLRTSSAVPG